MKQILRKDGQHECLNCHQIVPPSKPKWFHWLIEWCPKCECNTGQMVVKDDIGEDCNLFSKIDEHKWNQKHGEKPFLCDCGTKTVALYRHALADWNCITDDAGEPLSKAPLLSDQKEDRGTFMTQAEYDKRKDGLALGQEILRQLEHSS